MVYNKIYAQLGEERHIVLDPINYQYDVKQILVISGETVPDYYEADVCNVGDTATLTMVGTAADGVEIPDKFLLDGRNVLVYVVIPGSGGDVQTRYDITIPVDERAEREDIDPSEAEQQQIDSLINALNSGVARAEAAATAAAESATDAEGSAGESEDQAENAEAWAVGQRAGTDVETEDPTYHNNSKYYAGMAEAAAEEAGRHEANWESWVRRAESAADDAEGSARAAAGSKADAEAAAQTATQKAAAAGESAEDAAGSAAEARRTVDGGVGAINTARDGALTAIGQAGTTQTGAVNQAGAAQVTAVNQAGTTQAQAVEDKGAEVLDSIPQDYSDLVDDVADLTRHLSDLDGTKATWDVGKTRDLPNVLTQSSYAGWASVIVEASEGDIFYVRGSGGNNSRLWIFADSTGASVEASDTQLKTSDYIKLIAPAGVSYLACNSKTTDVYAYDLIIGESVSIQASRIEYIEHAISSEFYYDLEWRNGTPPNSGNANYICMKDYFNAGNFEARKTYHVNTGIDLDSNETLQVLLYSKDPSGSYIKDGYAITPEGTSFDFELAGCEVSFNIAFSKDNNGTLVPLRVESVNTSLITISALEITKPNVGVPFLLTPQLTNGSPRNPANIYGVAFDTVQPFQDPSVFDSNIVYTGSMNDGDYLIFGIYVYNSNARGLQPSRSYQKGYETGGVEITTDKDQRSIIIGDYVNYTADSYYAIAVWQYRSDGTRVALQTDTHQYCLQVYNYPKSIIYAEDSNSADVELLNARHVRNNVGTPLTLLHFADIHADAGALERINDQRIAYGNNVDDAICVGDIVGNSGGSISSWWNPYIMTCVGNHDSAIYSNGSYDWTGISMADRDAYYIAPFESNWDVVHTSGTSYYYKDYATQKVRLIVMDGMLYMGTPGAEATTQTAWLENLLSDAITNNLHVVIAIHAAHGGATVKDCTFSQIGTYTVAPTYSDCNTPQVIIDAVGTAISSGLKFVGYLIGHEHKDFVFDAENDGSQMMYCVTCANVSSNAQWRGSDQHRGTTLDAYNLITIDTANTLVKIVRGGGADVDDRGRQRKYICINYSTGQIVGETT